MPKRLLLVVSVAVALMALALPARAAGAQTTHLSFKGQQAEALFFSTSGCVETDAYVLAIDGQVNVGSGGPVANSVALTVVSQFDTCTQTQLLVAEGSVVLAPDAFQIDKGLTAATLTATIEVVDSVTGNSFPVGLSVSWTGSGNTITQKIHLQQKAPGFMVNSRMDETSRRAEASGTVSDGTTNFSPEPAFSADLASVKSGEVDIIHG